MNKVTQNERSPSSPYSRKPIREDQCEKESDGSEQSTSDDSDQLDRVKKIYPNLSKYSPRVRKRTTPKTPVQPIGSLQDKSPSCSSKSRTSPHDLVSQTRRKSKTSSSTPQLELEPDKPYNSTCVLLFLLAIIVGVVAYYLTSSSYVRNDSSPADIKSYIHSGLKNSIKMLNQSNHAYVQIIAQVNDMVDEVPLQPSILFIVVPQKAERTANCLVNHIARVVSSGFNDPEVLTFDVKNYLNDDVDEFKHKLENTLSKLSNSHCAIIRHLELMKPKAGNILHAFCDNENAHHKQALIMFMLNANEETYSLRLATELEVYIENKLYSLWSKELRKEHVAAIHTRIANAPLLVKPVKDEILDQFC